MHIPNNQIVCVGYLVRVYAIIIIMQTASFSVIMHNYCFVHPRRLPAVKLLCTRGNRILSD